jgi:hypothetical protein
LAGEVTREWYERYRAERDQIAREAAAADLADELAAEEDAAADDAEEAEEADDRAGSPDAPPAAGGPETGDAAPTGAPAEVVAGRRPRLPTRGGIARRRR